VFWPTSVAMGNTGSNAVSWWSAYEIAAKNFDPERFPRAVSNAGQANVVGLAY
jgi:hypothetical protein